MNLAAALRLSELPRLALVGAGGKSSALLCLAHELAAQQKTVLVTTTTHLGDWQLRAGNEHIILPEGARLDIQANFPGGIVFVTGPVMGDRRAIGLENHNLEHLLVLANIKKWPVLIEADGARQRPLKAPAEHEPVIPDFVNQIVVCAGLTCLGKPLNARWVHRPELVGQLSGLEQNELITPEAVSRTLLHPKGGLKGIPGEARRVLLLNQADTDLLQAQGNTIAQQCLQAYHAVVIAAFSKPKAESELDQVASSQPANIFAVHEATAGIILAAGGASRYGALKQLLPWKGQPLVWHVARTALTAGLSPVVVVTGSGGDQVAQALAGMPISLIHNPDWAAGQSTSLQAGLRGLPANCGGAVFMLADQPKIPDTLIRALIDAHSHSMMPIIVPLVDGKRGNPVLFDRTTFQALMDTRGDQGGRQVFSRYPIEYVPWHDYEILLDVDAPEDYLRLVAEGNQSSE